MLLEQYTPDAVCQALGLPGFAKDPAMVDSGCWVRLLLEPSFEPEVCVTLRTNDRTADAEVRTFVRQFWQMPTPAHRPGVYVERVAVPPEAIEENARRLAKAAEDLSRHGKRWVAIADGMPAIGACRLGGRLFELQAEISESAHFSAMWAELSASLHAALPAGRCRNAVAHAAGYVNVKLATAPTHKTVVSHLLVLGDEHGKRAVAERLDRERRDRRDE